VKNPLVPWRVSEKLLRFEGRQELHKECVREILYRKGKLYK
jgi:hypothetical protein